MSELNDLITSYKNLPFSDRVVFYTTVSNDISVDGGDLQPFLIETRMTEDKEKAVGLGGLPALHDGPEDTEGIGRGMPDLRIHCLCLAA